MIQNRVRLFGKPRFARALDEHIVTLAAERLRETAAVAYHARQPQMRRPLEDGGDGASRLLDTA